MFGVKKVAWRIVALRTAAILVLSPLPAVAAPARLEQVAKFDHQVTGVTVSPEGRIFVNFPRWTEDAPNSVAELGRNGAVTPYPDAEWNSWRNAGKDELSPSTHFVCVQSVVADRQGNLWVVDAGAPGNDKVVPGAAKLVRIDLKTNKVAQTILFDDGVAPKASYMNDLRVSPDGAYGYLTDSGQGALVVVDLKTGHARRVLDGDKTTQAEKDVVVKTDGQPLRRPDGRGVVFAADGIALSPDGEYLYWQALTGKTLYRVATAALTDESLKPSDLATKVEKAATTGPSDGIWIDEKGRLYLSDMQNNAVKTIGNLTSHANAPPGNNKIDIVVQDKRLRWPDTFSEGPNGAIYVTTSHIQDSPWFKPGAPNAIPTQLWKIDGSNQAVQ